MDDYVPDLVPSPDQKLIPGPIGRSKKGTLENSKIFGWQKSMDRQPYLMIGVNTFMLLQLFSTENSKPLKIKNKNEQHSFSSSYKNTTILHTLSILSK
jgi:hypothetical protein